MEPSIKRAPPIEVGPIRSFEDVARSIDRSPAPRMKPSLTIRLKWWESDMAVLISYEALMEMAPGDILRVETDRIATYPDIHAWTKRNPRFVLLGENYEGALIVYYLTRTRRPEVIDV
ncbi:MAG: sulfurtransferase TusA family protein [Candidatus Nitrospinota bacterium M3_3B_026]